MPERREERERLEPSGSSDTGKNVPENKNSGRIPSRMIIGNAKSVSCVTENAASGAQNAAAVSPATGIASTPQADGIAPSTAATARNTVAPNMARIAFQITKPPNTSRACSGVATMPW